MTKKIPSFYEDEPDSLKANSQALLALFQAEQMDEEALLALTMEREAIVKEMLKQPCDEDIIRAEYNTNQELLGIVTQMRDNTKSDLVKFLRNRKAAKKYQ